MQIDVQVIFIIYDESTRVFFSLRSEIRVTNFMQIHIQIILDAFIPLTIKETRVPDSFSKSETSHTCRGDKYMNLEIFALLPKNVCEVYLSSVLQFRLSISLKWIFFLSYCYNNLFFLCTFREYIQCYIR